MSDPTRSLPPADLGAVIGEYLEAVDEGHPPPPEELLGRHPELATDLRRFLAAQGAFEEIAGPFCPATPYRADAETVDTSPELPRGADGQPVPAVSSGGYDLCEEVGRGGMGAVYRARDDALGRDVAVKVLQERYRNDPAAARRFLTEARVTAELAHPGVPPVHAVGTLPDGRPFLAMKLIDGDGLDELLRDRPDATADRGRLLAAFERVCQAVAFAHAKGIVHRDLKPANIMVGRFGETLVMDWGLARFMRPGPGGPDAELATGDSPGAPESSGRTAAGSVLGTPAYMPPEQAAGELDRLDERADVFGLGAVLCATLTGQPPYTGVTTQEVHDKAVRANLTDCFARLDACGADAELVAVARRCLAANPADRYAHAGAVADAVASYRAGVDERLRRSERDRAAAEARAAEQRKRRKVQLGLAAAVLVIVAGGAGVVVWQEHAATERERIDGDRKAAEARAETEAGFKAYQARQGVAADLKLSAQLRKQYKFAGAAAALAQAEELARSGAPELLDAVTQARADLVFVVQLDDIRYRKWLWVMESEGNGGYNLRIAAPEYRKAFEACALDLAAVDPAAAARRIAASAVKAELVAAVDDWALHEPEPGLRDRLLGVARRADPGPWTDRLRDPAVRGDRAAVAKLAAEAGPAGASSAALTVLVELMKRRGLDPVRLLSAARVKHPTDFELAFALGLRHMSQEDARQVEAYEAARALRPENATVWVNLGSALHSRGDFDGAFGCFTEALRLDRRHPVAHYNLGIVLSARGDLDGAIAAYREAIKHNPKYARAHTNLGRALKERGDLDGAIASLKEAIRHDPAYTLAHYHLGLALSAVGDSDGAVVAYLRTVRDWPTYPAVYNHLGLALIDRGDLDGAIIAFKAALRQSPASVAAHQNLGVALRARGDLDGAIACHSEVIRLDRTYAPAHYNLGVSLKARGDVDGAVAAYREAIKYDPAHTRAYAGLGTILCDLKRDYDGAVTCFKVVLRFDPDSPSGHYNLGNALSGRGDTDAAIACFKETLRLDPKHAGARTNLGNALRVRGNRNEALAAYREAIKHDPTFAPAHYQLGLELNARGDPKGAIAAFREAVRHDPTHAKAYYALGIVLKASDDVDGAVAAYRAAIKHDPTHARAYANLGAILCDVREDYDGAIDCFRKALRLDPNYALAHHNLGVALKYKGDIGGAIAAWREAIRLNPKYASAYYQLGSMLARKGDDFGTRTALQEAARLDPKRYGYLLKQLPPIPVAPPPRAK